MWIRALHPTRVIPVAGRGASVAEILAAHAAGEEIDGIVPFVTRRAWRALDECERQLRGNRYKVPRFIPETILSRRSFVEAVSDEARATGVDPTDALRKAERYLDEIAATHSPYVIDLIANAIHTLYRQGYGRIHYHPDQVSTVAELGHRHPVVFLPSHRSHLDRLSLQFLLWENDLPPNHTAGGINLDFFPVGPLMRRTGVFFIRRSFKDDELYKLVLRAYIDFLIEKRFSLEWYMEGGRSRSGRLQSPRFGLLHYVVDAMRRGKADDVMLVPVSIAYDQIQDVPDYTREALGRPKEKETLGWMLRAIRSLRRRYGDIYIRFGDAVSVAGLAGEIGPEEEPGIGLQKLAFEVMHRIGMVTPVTPLALVSIALLGSRGRAQSAAELALTCSELERFVTGRDIEMTEKLDLSDPVVVSGLLGWLSEHGAVSTHEALGRVVYWLDDEQTIQVAYYRNVILHYFIPRAIAEMALRGGPTTAAELWEEILAIRDLLKFEFFFAERERFLADVRDDLGLDVPDWERLLGDTGPGEVLEKLGTTIARWAVLPILDGYRVVSDELESLRTRYEEKAFLKSCAARARMYRIEGRLTSAEGASQVVFKSALALAANRGLLEGAARDDRARFAAEIRAARQSAAVGL
jgi:glycerol-3-phosphate O-acyltransferase